MIKPPGKTTMMLSKSRILSGLQCPKRLYLEVHRPELAEVDESAAQRMASGERVNEVARSLVPGGILVEEDSLTGVLRETQRLLAEASETSLFEATFSHGDTLVRADILHKKPSGSELIEVKAAASIKGYYYQDCAVQAWVIEGAGLPLKAIKLAHIDSRFVYPGGGDYRGLFAFVDLSDLVFDISRSDSHWIPYWIEQFKEVLEGSEPDIAIGKQCHDPFDCPFQNYCTPPQPEYPVSILPRGGKVVEELLAEGITDLRDVPNGRLMNPVHEWVRQATLKGEAKIIPGAAKQLRSLPYPRYYLDFETIAFAVPIWPGTRPYQQLPFQWSCHIEEAPGKIRHEEFLDISGEPPMRLLVEQLLEVLVKTTGPVFMYSPFERRVLRELAGMYPDLQAAIAAVVDRLVDLLPIVRNHYYHPAMKGSWSIKAVLPTIAPELAYDTLGEVRDGGAAQLVYLDLIEQGTEPMDDSTRIRLTEDMKEYCKRDTLGMVELVSFLTQV